MKTLDEIEWKAFKLSSIFNVEKCKCSKVADLSSGNVPYVGATNRNNGIMAFVGNYPKLITKGNCIAFICDGEGSIGYSIYEAKDFIGSTTVKIGRNQQLNKYNALFITTIADMVRGKYNFGFKRNEKHLKNEILFLPVTAKGEPDYAYMEQYMRVKEQNILGQYLGYLEKSKRG